MKAEPIYPVLLRRESYFVVVGLFLYFILIWIFLYMTGYLLNGWWLGLLWFGLTGYVSLRDYFLKHKIARLSLQFRSKEHFVSGFIKDMTNFGFVSRQVSLVQFELKADIVPLLKFFQYQFPVEDWGWVMLDVGTSSASLVGPKETLRLIRIHVLQNSDANTINTRY